MVCIPGGGWSILTFDRVDLDVKRPFNRAMIERNGSKQLVYYWYEERGRTIASEYWSKWYLFVDALTKNRSDGALVRLVTDVARDEQESDADRRLHSFMASLFPTLPEFLPMDPSSPSVKLSEASVL